MKPLNISFNISLTKFEHLATMYLVSGYSELAKYNDAINVLSKYLEKTDFSNFEGFLFYFINIL